VQEEASKNSKVEDKKEEGKANANFRREAKQRRINIASYVSVSKIVREEFRGHQWKERKPRPLPVGSEAVFVRNLRN